MRISDWSSDVCSSYLYFRRFLPGTDCAPELADEYNRRVTADYEEIRDFVILHYCLTGRCDTAFWLACAAKELPPSLARRIALFRITGTITEPVDSKSFVLGKRVSVRVAIGGRRSLKKKKYKQN